MSRPPAPKIGDLIEAIDVRTETVDRPRRGIRDPIKNQLVNIAQDKGEDYTMDLVEFQNILMGVVKDKEVDKAIMAWASEVWVR